MSNKTSVFYPEGHGEPLKVLSEVWESSLEAGGLVMRLSSLRPEQEGRHLNVLCVFVCLQYLCSSEVLPSSRQRKGKFPPLSPSLSPPHWKQCRPDLLVCLVLWLRYPLVPFQNLQCPHLLGCLASTEAARNQGTQINRSKGKRG